MVRLALATDLAELTIAQLASLYNTRADVAVTKFSSKANGLQRVMRLCEERGLDPIVEGDEITLRSRDEYELTSVVEPTIAQVAEAALDPAASMPLSETTEPQAELVREAAVIVEQQRDTPAGSPIVRRVRGPAPMHADEDFLTVLTHNKKRVGSASHARFALYVDGMTVGDYLDACVALQGGKREKYRADIRWDHAHGFVGSYTPHQWENSHAGRDIEEDGQQGA